MPHHPDDAAARQSTPPGAASGTDQQTPADDAFQTAAEQHEPGLLREFLEFLIHNKKWWLTPILIVLGLIGLVAVAVGTGAAPFIYALF